MLSVLLSNLFACPLWADPQVIIAAASDLAPLEKQMRALVPGQELKFVFGSSGQLAAQIRAGAPFDVFLSADLSLVRQLETEGRLVVGSARAYARGRLALYAKGGETDLAKARTIAIANPAHAPYGVAARQVLRARPDWAALSGRIVYAENVRQALQFAESGNTDAALVAWSLVKDKPGAVLLPDSSYAPIVQGLGVVRGKAADADRTARAILFVDALMSKPGQAALREGGFAVGRDSGKK